MERYRYKTPDGFNDILHKECRIKLKVEDSIRSIINSYGYKEVETPTLEYYDLFSGSIGTLPQEKMFKTFDSKGRILALRPDITVPIMRMVATKMGDEEYPLRISYFGNIFRNNNKDLINSEYKQAGIEIIGTESITADAEIIEVSINSLLKAGIDDFRIDIGQVKFFKILTKDINDEDIVEEIRQAVANKDRSSIKELLKNVEIEEKTKNKILRLPWIFGSLDVIHGIEDIFNNEDERKALDELEKLIEILISWGYEKYISIDLGMVQSLNYYSGLIFRGYTVDYGFAICWGGRYDNLSENFNKDISAVGCGIGIKRIVEILEKDQRDIEYKGADYLIATSDSILNKKEIKIAQTLRNKGLIVENGLISDEEELYSYCDNKKIGKIIKILQKDIVQIKDLKSGEEQEYTIDHFLQ